MIDIRAVPVGRTIGRRRVDADERLVARALAGDDGAFEEIYERYHVVLLAFCRHLLGSREEAEDALQACFASAYRMLSSGVGAARLKPWLFTIARN
ncbi:MAG TPA: RNA polymerase sigma factor, partial [Solirubrobacteraceae bacterium]|nr:RNA polymerase sigma factor [Solirubrobacteraceae bacterium]